jgi:serine/threonine protein kinase
MSPAEGNNELSMSAEWRIDAACLRFEEAWKSVEKSGPPPRVEDFIGQAAGREQQHLLGHLVQLDLVYRRQRGERPTAQEYCQRFPEHAELMQRVFPLVSEAEPTHQWQGHPDESTPAGSLRLIGRYRVIERLGIGGQGDVYRAVDPALRRDVVIKLARAGLPEAACRKLLDEGRILAKLDDPGLVRVLDSGVCDGRPFLVFEHIPGRSLAEVVRQQRVSPRRAAEWAAELAATLERVHRKDVRHYDLKPANVLIDERGKLRLLDFGLASLAQIHGTVVAPEGASGTLAYMAPEQARGQSEALGVWTDVFGLGALLYRLLTGHPPHEGTNQDTVIEQVLEGRVTPVRQVNASVPRALERICRKAMAPDPKQRYSSAGEMGRALRAYLRRGRVIGIGLATLVVAMLAWMLWPGTAERISSSPPPSDSGPTSGELTVRIWSPTKPGLLVSQDGALPVRNKEQVQIEATLDQPGHIYLLLVGGSGKVAPLYPWNEGTKLVQKDAAAPPPIRPASKLIVSPADQQSGWRMAGKSGLETVLMAARRTPLPEEVSLGRLIGKVPVTPLRRPQEWAVLLHRETGDPGPSRERGDREFEEEAAAIDEPVVQVMARLREHFEVVRAVRFAHQE